MGRGKKVLGIVLGCLILLLLVAGAGWYTLQKVPPIAEQIPPGYSPIHVHILNPLNHTSWPLNSFIPIQVSTESKSPITALELYVNGVLYESKAASDSRSSPQQITRWDWQPGLPGEFLLLVRAISQDGQAGVSNLVQVRSREGATTVMPVAAAAGETLTSLAVKHQVAVAVLEQANPGIAPLSPLSPGTRVDIPNPPIRISNPHLIPSLTQPDPGTPSGQSGETPSSPASEAASPGEPADVGAQQSSGQENPGSQPSDPLGPASQANLSSAARNFFARLFGSSQKNQAPHTTILQDLRFSFDLSNPNANKKAPKQPPPAPKLQGDFSGCNVKLNLLGWYYDPNDPLAIPMNEDGFFVYRSRDGAAFERIYTIPPVHDSNDDKNLHFTDPDQSGNLTYTVSAFNVLGESMSNPVTIPLDATTCKGHSLQGLNQIHLEDGDLVLPFSMDMAYLYIQINGSPGVRVPAGDRTFLPGSGIKFNLNTYLDSLVDSFQATDVDVSMEVWGWVGGQLKFAGKVHTQVHRTVLTICSVEGEGGCTGSGGGKWVKEIEVSREKPVKDQKYEVRWQSTSLTSADGYSLQLAGSPFYGPNYNDTQQILYAGEWPGKGQDVTFTLPLGYILYPNPPHANSDIGWGQYSKKFEYTSNGFLDSYPPDQPFTVYARVLPHLAMKGLSVYSNTLTLHRNTPPLPSEMPPLSSPLASLFEVEILQETYKPPDFLVEENWGCVIVDEDPTGTYTPSPTQYVCPGKIQHTSDCGDWDLVCLVKGFGESLADLGNYVIFGINVYKDEIASDLASVFCSDNQTCEDAVGKAVDYGVAALTGLPPDLPNFEDLVSKNITSLIVTYVAGIDDPTLNIVCDSACQDQIGAKLISRLKQGKSIQSQPACMYGYDAYFHGQQPACLDPSIIVHPAPGATNQPAFVQVRLTRKTTPESLAAQKEALDQYRLEVTVQGEKFDPNYQQNVVGPLYQPVRLTIPWIEPGQSLTIPIVLQQNYQLVQGTTVDKAFPVSVNTANLFPGGTSHMRATESCYSASSTWEWVPCTGGGIDQWDFTNP